MSWQSGHTAHLERIGACRAYLFVGIGSLVKSKTGPRQSNSSAGDFLRLWHRNYLNLELERVWACRSYLFVGAASLVKSFGALWNFWRPV